MAAQPQPPVWINLEYLSAEAYVERSHGLRSPQFSGPGAGLDKWFFYPGFSPATGGLLQHPPPPTPAAAQAWLAQRGWAPLPASAACCCSATPTRRCRRCWQRWPAEPTLLWLPPGPMQAQLAGQPLPAGLRQQALPWLTLADFDRAAGRRRPETGARRRFLRARPAAGPTARCCGRSTRKTTAPMRPSWTAWLDRCSWPAAAAAPGLAAPCARPTGWSTAWRRGPLQPARPGRLACATPQLAGHDCRPRPTWSPSCWPSRLTAWRGKSG